MMMAVISEVDQTATAQKSTAIDDYAIVFAEKQR